MEILCIQLGRWSSDKALPLSSMKILGFNPKHSMCQCDSLSLSPSPLSFINK